MNIFRFPLLASLLTMFCLVGCADDFDPGDPALDGARLEFVSEQTQTLQFGETANLEVRYVYSDGNPIPNAPLTYDISGQALDSSLSATGTTTSSSGQGNVDLRAGSSNVTFQVGVTPPRGERIIFTIAVSDTAAGSIVAEMNYGGERILNQFTAYLFRDQPCAGLDATTLPTAEVVAPSVSRLTHRPAFAGVAVGSNYSIAIRGENGAGLAAFGCTDNIEVMAQKETRVTVTLYDLFGFDGVYELDNQLDFGGLLPGSVRSTVDILSELGDDQDIDCMSGMPDNCGQDPGAFLLDFVMRQTCAWECAPGEDFDSCSETNHPTGDISAVYDPAWRTSFPSEPIVFGACGLWQDVHVEAQNYINNQVAMLLPGGVLGFVNSASDIAAAINNAQIQSVLELGAPSTDGMATMRHTLETMTVTLRDLSGMPTTTIVDLREAGLSMLSADAMAAVEGTTLMIPAHSFGLNYGRLVQYIYRTVLLPTLGYASTAEMLAAWVDCEAIADRIAMSVGTGLLSRDDYLMYCDLGIAAAGLALEASLPDVVGGEGTLTLMGSGEFVVPSSGTTATAINPGMWMGSWGEGMDSGSITGEFMGMRR